MTFDSGETRAAVLRGFTITGGSASHGGGIHVSSASPTLQDLVIDGCEAGSTGGGLYVEDSEGLFEAITIQGGEAMGFGGGLAVQGLAPAEFLDIVLVGNDAIDGGGLYLSDAAATFEGLWAEANTASTTGGNVFIDGGAPALTGASIVGGYALFGGGLFAADTGAELVNVEFRANDAWWGGAVWQLGTPGATYTGVRVLGNTADYAAGIYAETATVVTLDHCVVAGNVATMTGGGVWASGSTVLATDSAVAFNEAWSGAGVAIDGGTAVLQHCDVWGNTPDDYAGMADPTGTQGNISVDPLFMDTSAVDPWDWDLHPQVSSPMVDAGGGSADPDGSTSDIGVYGGTYGGSWDLDLDGYPEWWQPGPYDAATYPALGWDCDDEDPGTYPGNGC